MKHSLLFLCMLVMPLGVAHSRDLPLKDHDRIIFLGDSITDARKWTHYVSSYLILRNPALRLHIQTEGRGGSTVPEVTDRERYARRVSPYGPQYVFTMFGHNGGATAQEWGASVKDLCENYIQGISNAVPILIGPHPRNDATGKLILGDYENEFAGLAGANSFPFALTWHALAPAWTANSVAPAPIDLGYEGTDLTHPGTAGHIAIAHTAIELLGFGSDVSAAEINAAKLTVTSSSSCEISNLKANGYAGIDFERLDARLPWAIDESGRPNATAFKPQIKGWQKYLQQIEGLRTGDYQIFIDDVLVATKTTEELTAGWNMADLTAGPVHGQCQEVLGLIRDMHGVDRSTLTNLPLPNKGVVRYKSNADYGYNRLGLRGQDLLLYLKPALDEIEAYDIKIHDAARPKVRHFSVRRVGATPLAPHPLPDYIPPIGIPMPRWGACSPIQVAKPAQPASWPSGEAAGYFYVDSAHPNATDNGNEQGFPDKPRLTIPANLEAGSMVVVANCRENTRLTVRGTETAPVWIIGTGPATIRPAAVGSYLNIVSSSHIIVDGINFDGTGTPNTYASTAFAIRDGSNRICIRNCAVRNMVAPPYNPSRFASGGAGAWYSALTNISPSNGNVSDVVLYNTVIEDNCGGQALDYENGRHALIASGDSHGIYRVENLWILNCTFDNNSEDGIQLGQTSNRADQTLCRNIYIGGNTIINNGENAIDLKACDRILVSQNTFSGYVKTNYRAGAVSGSDGTACVINDDGRGPLESWWIFNTIHSSRAAFRNQAAGGQHYFIGNRILNLRKDSSDVEPASAGSSAGVAYWQSGGGQVYLLNNTVSRVHGGFYINNAATIEISGNIVSDLMDHTVGWPVNLNNFNSATLGANFYFDPNGPVRRDANAIDPSDNLDVDPKLTDSAKGDLRPLAGSPVLGAMAPPATYGAFTAAFGASNGILVDFDRRPRPPERWSSGTYELGVISSPSRN